MVIKPIAGIENAIAVINLVKDLKLYEDKIIELKAVYDKAASEIARLNSLYPGVDLITKAADAAALTEQTAKDKLNKANTMLSEAEKASKKASEVSKDLDKKLLQIQKREADVASQAKSVSDAAAKLVADQTKFEDYKRQEIATIMEQKADLQAKIDAAKALLG